MSTRLLRRNIQIISASHTFFVVCCIAFLAIVAAEYRLFQQTAGIHKDTYRNITAKTAEALRLTMNEIQRLSYMLMINTDVQAFIMQGKIESGSSDIQTLIDAQHQLSYIKSVYPVIDSLYLYSKKSDYLLGADNAFFDIDAMYTAFFKFRGLNSKQWQARYLKPVLVNTWQPESSIISKGIEKKLLVFEQTFPLQNSTANAGKLIILLKTDYLEHLFSALLSLKEVSIWLTDSQYNPLFVRSKNLKGTDAQIQAETVPALSAFSPFKAHLQHDAEGVGLSLSQQCINGKNFLVFAQPIRSTGTTLIVSIPQFTVFSQLLSVHFIVSVAVMCLLLCFIGRNAFAFFSVKSYTKTPLLKPELPADLQDQTVKISDDEKSREVSAAMFHGKDAPLIKRIEEYIEQSYSNPLLNLSQMAKDFSITENFLYYFFRSRMQKSFAQYLEEKRLEKAHLMLKEGLEEPLAVLAYRCGYANVQTFRRAFKKRYGLTPSEFRHQRLP